MRLTTLGDRSNESARRRNTELPALRREISGDLDWITLKAMAKERSRRYGSPQELAADLRRFLDDDPVLATPPSASYRLKKYVKRHRVGVTAAVASLLVLIAFAVTMTVQAGRIAAQRDRANDEAAAKGHVSEFLKNLFVESDPAESRGSSLTVRQVLDEGAKKIEALPDDAVRTELMRTIGDVYRKLGHFPEAEGLLQGAVDERRRLLGDEHPDTLTSFNDLGFLFWQQARYDEAETILSAALETARDVLGEDDPVERQRRTLGEEHPSFLGTASNLAGVHIRQGNYALAEQLLSDVLEIESRTLGDDHPGTLATRTNLAIAYKELGRLDESAAMFEENLALQRRVLGDDHPGTLRTVNILGLVYIDLGRHEEAHTMFIRNLEARRRVIGEEHPETLLSMGNLGLALKNLDRLDEAIDIYLAALEIQERTLGVGDPNTAVNTYNLAQLYRDTDRFERSAEYFRRTIEVDEKSLGPDHPYVADDLEEYAKLRRKMGMDAEADELEARVKAIRGE